LSNNYGCPSIGYNVPTLGNSAGLKHPTLFANNGKLKIQNFLYVRRPHFAKRVLATALILMNGFKAKQY
jgi:hypothetical protein